MKNRTAPTLTALALAAITIFGIASLDAQAAAIEGRQSDINIADEIGMIDADIADINIAGIAIEQEDIAERISDSDRIADINIADEIGLIGNIEIRNSDDIARLDCVRIDRICDEATIVGIV